MASALDEFLKKFDPESLALPAARQEPVTPSSAPPPIVVPQPAVPARLPRPRPVGPMDDWAARVEGAAESAASPLDDWAARVEQISLENQARNNGQSVPEGGSASLPEGPLVAAGETPPSPEGTQSVPGAFVRGVARGFNRAQQAGPSFRLATGATPFGDQEDALLDLAEQQAQERSYAIDPDVVRAAQEWEALPDEFLGSLKFLWDNPKFLATVLGESLGSSALSAPAGAIGGVTGGPVGAAAGVGIGSGLTEFGSAFTSFMAEKYGIDISDEDQIKGFLSDPKAMAAAREYATRRGVVVGAFDAITGLVAPKILRGVETRLGRPAPAGVTGRTTTRGSRIAGAGAGLGTEAVGGAAGEGAAQLVTEGTISMKDMILEGVGEFLGGAPELGVTTAYAAAGRGATTNLTQASDEDIRRALGGGTEERFVSPEEAEAEGRTLYGFDTGEGPVQLGTYEEAEQQAGLKGVRNGRLIAVSPEQAQAIEGPPKLSDLVTSASPPLSTIINEVTAPSEEVAEKMIRAIRNYYETSQGYEQKLWEDLYDEAVAEGASFSNIDSLGSRRPKAVFSGDSSQLGVLFREVDYGGLVVPTSIDAQVARGGDNGFVELSNFTFGDHTEDVDLKKLSVGTLIPTMTGLRAAADSYGESTLEQMAWEAGSDEAAVQSMLGWLRDPLDMNREETEKALDSGNLRFRPDTRLTLREVKIRATPEALQEIKNAKVRSLKKPQALSREQTTNRLRYQTSNIRRLDNTVGSASFIWNDQAMAWTSANGVSAIRAAMGVMERLIKEFKLPFDVQVVPWVPHVHNPFKMDRPHPPPVTTAYGFLGGEDLLLRSDGAPRATIGVALTDAETGAVRTPQQLYMTLTHEFGHFLSMTGFMQMSPEHRTRILAAYRRFLLVTTAQTNQDPRRMSGFPGRELGMLEPNYHYRFEEWFADQIARWALTNRQPLGFVARTVKPIARLLLRAMKTFQKYDPTNLMRAEPEIENWLAENLSGRTRGGWATTILKWHEEETRKANERANRGNDNGPMTPMTSQSVPLRESMAKIGLQNIEAMATEMGVAIPALPALFSQVDRFNWFYEWFLSLPQVAERNLDTQPLQIYRELLQLMQLEQGNIMTGAHERLRQWRSLGRAQAEAFGQMLFDITQMNYLSAAERQAGVVRHPTPSELRQMVRQYGISAQGLQLYAGVRQDFQEALNRYITQLVEKAQRSITDPAGLQRRLNEIAKMHQQLLKRPYFPMTRYGNWTLTVRNQGQIVHFETFESKRQMQQAYKRAAPNFPQGSGFTIQMGVLREEARPFLGVPPQMLDLMAQTLQLSPAQIAALEQLKFDLAPQQSFRKRFLKRSEISGWSEDAQRNYAHYFFHHAKHFTRVKYGELLREQVDAVHRLKGLRGGDATKIGRIANFMNRHMDETLNPKTDWASVRSAVAVWYLGFVPQSALLNLTQLGFATAPFLANKFGDVKTLNAMRKATLRLTNFYKKGTIRNLQTTTELRALAEAMDEGLIDESQAAELAALSEGNTILAGVPGGDIRKRWTQISGLAMGMFQQAEQFNRRVTFRAAWQLAMDNPNTPWLRTLMTKHQLQLQRLISRGWSHQEAVAFLAGKDAVLSTQFEYAKYARPRFMQGRKGAIFMFFMFTQNMLFMLWNNKGTIPRFLLTMAFIGGMMGLPGMEDADEIIKAIAARFGKDWDIEREARKYIVEVIGDPYWADLAMRGVGRDALNLGILHDIAGITWMPQIDLSRQISMGRILPINPAFLLGTPGMSQEKAFRDAVVNNAGAAFGVGYNLWKSLQTNPFNDPKTWEAAMPRSIKNVARAARIARQGQETDKSPIPSTVATFDIQDPQEVAEVVAITLGLQPTRLARAWDHRIAKIEVENFWEHRRGIVMTQFARAAYTKDPDMMEAAREAVRRFNAETPYKSTIIRPDNIKRSLQQRFQTAQRRSAGLPTRKFEASIVEELNRIYPGSNVVDVRRPSTLERSVPPDAE